MENTQNKSQVESTGSAKQNKKLVILVAVLAVVTVLALSAALGFGLRAQRLGATAEGVVYEPSDANVNGDYSFASLIKLTKDDLMGFTKAELRIMRNEIYARNGYIFQDRKLREYFMQKSWYSPVTRDVSLTQIEQYNVLFIKGYEE